MSEQRNNKTKLTEAGGGVCVLSFIALILSVAGVVTELVTVKIYNEFYDNYVEHIISTDFKSYISVYEKSLILTVLSLIVFISSANALRKKKLGAGFCALTLLVPAVIAIKPVLDVIDIADNGSFYNAMSNGSDGEKFRAVINLSVCSLPVLSCFLLVLCGVILVGKLITDNYSAEVPSTKRVAVMPVSEDSKPEKAVEPQFEFKHDNVIIPDTTQTNTAFADENVKQVSAHITPAEPDAAEQSVQPQAEEKTETKPDTIVCKECGEEIPATCKFCKNCGRPVF